MCLEALGKDALCKAFAAACVRFLENTQNEPMCRAARGSAAPERRGLGDGCHEARQFNLKISLSDS